MFFYKCTIYKQLKIYSFFFFLFKNYKVALNSLFLAIEKIPQKNKEEEGLGGKTKINIILYSRYNNEAKTRA